MKKTLLTLLSLLALGNITHAKANNYPIHKDYTYEHTSELFKTILNHFEDDKELFNIHYYNFFSNGLYFDYELKIKKIGIETKDIDSFISRDKKLLFDLKNQIFMSPIFENGKNPMNSIGDFNFYKIENYTLLNSNSNKRVFYNPTRHKELDDRVIAFNKYNKLLYISRKSQAKSILWAFNYNTTLPIKEIYSDSKFTFNGNYTLKVYYSYGHLQGVSSGKPVQINDDKINFDGNIFSVHKAESSKSKIVIFDRKWKQYVLKQIDVDKLGNPIFTLRIKDKSLDGKKQAWRFKLIRSEI